jgi:hypothetical protein
MVIVTHRARASPSARVRASSTRQTSHRWTSSRPSTSRASSRVVIAHRTPRITNHHHSRATTHSTRLPAFDDEPDVAVDALGSTSPDDSFVAFGFALAVVLLVVITGGVAYVAFREAMDRREETRARDEEARRTRVLEANPSRAVTEKKGKRKSRATPSQVAAMTREEEDARGTSRAGNRRDRRRAARREATETEEET